MQRSFVSSCCPPLSRRGAFAYDTIHGDLFRVSLVLSAAAARLVEYDPIRRVLRRVVASDQHPGGHCVDAGRGTLAFGEDHTGIFAGKNGLPLGAVVDHFHLQNPSQRIRRCPQLMRLKFCAAIGLLPPPTWRTSALLHWI